MLNDYLSEGWMNRWMGKLISKVINDLSQCSQEVSCIVRKKTIDFRAVFQSTDLLGQCRLFFLIFNVLITLFGIWDLSSLTRDQSQAPCSGSMEA